LLFSLLLLDLCCTDVVQGIVKAMDMRERCAGETFILCPDKGLTYQRWIEIIAKEVGRAKPFIHLPFPIVKLATAILAPIMNIGKQRTFMYQAETGACAQRKRFFPSVCLLIFFAGSSESYGRE